jgi:hypothetical protein
MELDESATDRRPLTAFSPRTMTTAPNVATTIVAILAGGRHWRTLLV